MIYCSQKLLELEKNTVLGSAGRSVRKHSSEQNIRNQYGYSSCQGLESFGETVLGLYGLGIPGIIRLKISPLCVQGGCGRHAKTYLAHDLMEYMGQSFFLHISLAIKVSLYSILNKTCQSLLKETSVLL